MNKGYIFGDYVAMDSETEIETKMVRKTVVDDLCDEIRRIARDYPEDFFLEKDIDGIHTIGAKLIVPYMSSEPKKENL